MQPLVVVAVLMFLGASLHDLRERRVRNRYWVPFVVVAALHWATLLFDGPFPWRAVAWAAGSSGLFYVLWRIRMYGGADAKGLMVVAWMVPSVPSLDGATTLALDALVNATFVMVALPVLFFGWNAIRLDVRVPAMFLGIRMSLQRARGSHVWPMQVRTTDGLRFRYRMPPTDELQHEWDALERGGIGRPWVTPKIPFMLPLTAGLLLAAWFGDLVLRAVATLVAKASI